MPAVIENFVVRVRELHADEEYVMVAFERHADHCPQCTGALQTHRQGGSLCDRGRQYAIDVADYLYSHNGKACSVVDREQNQRTLVNIPRDCAAVRSLLVAIEEGLSLRRRGQAQAPIISHEDAHRQVLRRSTAPYNEIIEREPRAATKRRRIIIYESPRGSPSRGTLYDSDVADRIKRQYETTRIHRPAEYYR